MIINERNNIAKYSIICRSRKHFENIVPFSKIIFVLLIIKNYQEEVQDVDKQDFAAKHKEVLKNRLYGLLCEKEKDGSWEDFLDNILVDLTDLAPNDDRSYDYYVLVAKLSRCRYLSYKYFRKTIFECMNLIDRIDVI